MKSYSDEMKNPKSKKMMDDASLSKTLKANPISETELSDISESNAAKGLRNYGRMYKQGLGMKPETPYEYKKGGKVKKMRKFEEGGDVEFQSKMGANPQIDENTRIRAMDYAQMMQEPAPEIETREAPKAKPRVKPKAEPKVEPKSESKKETFGRDIRNEKQKAAGEEPSFLKGTKGYNLSDVTRYLRRKAGITSYKSGGKVSSASKRADGIAIRGKTRI